MEKVEVADFNNLVNLIKDTNQLIYQQTCLLKDVLQKLDGIMTEMNLRRTEGTDKKIIDSLDNILRAVEETISY